MTVYRILLYICLLLAISSVSLAESLKPAHSAEISIEEWLECSESEDSHEFDEAPLWHSLLTTTPTPNRPTRAPVSSSVLSFALSYPIRAPPELS
ncbi:hypothetical protein [Pseudoteredinibacter isoporae]|uniref:hypothetical protein n=1 Tax=Pseudoteredinibacter isoporae TaxID=570281 RepID=UPI0033413890